MHEHDPFGRVGTIPPDLSREGRVSLLAEAAGALMRGATPSLAARLFLGGALTAWLAEGGDLTRDYLRVDAPRGSHLRPERIARRLIGDERLSAPTLKD